MALRRHTPHPNNGLLEVFASMYASWDMHAGMSSSLKCLLACTPLGTYARMYDWSFPACMRDVKFFQVFVAWTAVRGDVRLYMLANSSNLRLLEHISGDVPLFQAFARMDGFWSIHAGTYGSSKYLIACMPTVLGTYARGCAVGGD